MNLHPWKVACGPADALTVHRTIMLGRHLTLVADAMHFWEESSGHRTNLLRPNVAAIGVAMAKDGSGRLYWTCVLAAE